MRRLAVPDLRECMRRLLEGMVAKDPLAIPELGRLLPAAIRLSFDLLVDLARDEHAEGPSAWRRQLAEWIERPNSHAIGIAGILRDAPFSTTRRASLVGVEPHALMKACDALSRASFPLGYREWVNLSRIDPRDLGAMYEALQPYRPVLDRTARSLVWRSDEKEQKARGSYYTPRQIVTHMVRCAVEARDPTPETGRAARILDPAMGSGYFLIEAGELMVSHLSQEAESSALRREIALTSLHGVDVDPVAVHVARLALSTWITGGLDDSHVDALSMQLREGDSILSSLDGSQPSWRTWFPDVLRSPSAGCDGFDVVVANPPYDNSRGGLRENNRLQEVARHVRAGREYDVCGAIDLYRLFLQRSIRLCRAGGALSLVVPRSLLGDRDAVPDRRLLMAETQVVRIDDFPYDDSQRRVFPGAALAACIVTAVRAALPAPVQRDGPPEPGFPLFRWPDAGLQQKPQRRWVDPTHVQRFWPETVPMVAWSAAEIQALERLNGREDLVPLEVLADLGIGEVSSGYHREQIRSYPTGTRLVRGAEVRAYGCEPNRSWLDLNDYLASLSPAARARLRAGEPRIAKQAVKNTSMKKRLVATPVDENWFLSDSTDYLIPRPGVDRSYLLALLNSRTVLEWLFQRTSTNNNVNLYQIRRLPVPKPPAWDQGRDPIEARRLAGRLIRHALQIEPVEVRREPESDLRRRFESTMRTVDESLPGPEFTTNRLLHDVVCTLAHVRCRMAKRSIGETGVDPSSLRREAFANAVDGILDAAVWRLYGWGGSDVDSLWPIVSLLY